MKLSTNELLHRRWNEALPGDRATRDGVIYQLSEKGEWLYVEDPYDGQSIRAHKDHAIEAEAVAAEARPHPSVGLPHGRVVSR